MPRFAKRVPTKEELEKANSRKDFIRKRLEAGEIVSNIAKRLNVPVLAVEDAIKNMGMELPTPKYKVENPLDLETKNATGKTDDTNMETMSATGADGTLSTPNSIPPSLNIATKPSMGIQTESRPRTNLPDAPPFQAQMQQQASMKETSDVDRKYLRKPAIEKAASEAVGEQQKPAALVNDPMAHEFPQDLPLSNNFPSMATFGAQQVPGQAAPAVELAGVFDVPLVYKTLFYTLTELGAKPEQARGIVRIFRYYPPDDYVGLDEILKDAGLSPGTRRLVVKSWRLASQDSDATIPSDEKGVPSADTEQARAMARKKLNMLKQELGIPTPGDINAAVEDLERQRMMYEVEEAKERLKQLQKGGAARDDDGDSETVEVLVDINGVPVKKTIRQKDYHIWEPVIIKPKGGGGDGDDTIEVTLDINGVRAKKKIKIDEIGKWEKYIVKEESTSPGDYTTVLLDMAGIPVEKKIRTADIHLYAPYMRKPAQQGDGQSSPELADLRKQVSQMADMLAQERAERAREKEEEKRQREFESMRAEIAQLRSSPRSADDPVQRRIEEMEKMIQTQKDESYRQQMAELQRTLESYRSEISHLRDQLNTMNNFDYALEQQRRFDQMARKQGYVGPQEVNRLTEEDIRIEDERNMVKRKDEAQARALNIAASKLEKTGDLKNAFISKGGADVLVDTLKRITTSKEEQAAGMYTPTVEDLARKAQEIVREEQAAQVAPPVQEQQPTDEEREAQKRQIGDRQKSTDSSIDIA